MVTRNTSTTLLVSAPEEQWPEWARPRNLRHMQNYDHINPQLLLAWALAQEQRIKRLEENETAIIRMIADRIEKKDLTSFLIERLQQIEKENEDDQ
jgi:hypothetical protein